MRGHLPNWYYWRDNHGLEIDFVLEKGGRSEYLIEMKVSAAYDPHVWANVDKLADDMGLP